MTVVAERRVPYPGRCAKCGGDLSERGLDRYCAACGLTHEAAMETVELIDQTE